MMATASTGSFWDDDPEEAAKKRVNELKRIFHSGRQLQIKHLPRDVTEEVSVNVYYCVCVCVFVVFLKCLGLEHVCAKHKAIYEIELHFIRDVGAVVVLKVKVV